MVKLKKGKLLIVILLLVVLSACDTTKDNIFAPNKRLLTHFPKQADLYPDYKKGWLDGCQTGMATGFANDYYKTFYKFSKDRDMVKKGVKPYLRAWSSAMIYCRHYAIGTLKEGGLNPRLPGEGWALPLGGDSKGKTSLPTAGHGILETWQPYRHGAQGLAKW